MDLIEDIGPILGIVAFLGFAILALLIVLQAREVRRLREWAGRAPERAREADEADRAAAEARGEMIKEEEAEPGRIAAFRGRVGGAVGPRYAALDRHSPVDLRWFLAALLAGLIAIGVVTSGFGLVGGDEPVASEDGGRGGKGGGGGGGDGKEQDQQPEVTVLNATQIDDPVAPVPAVPDLANQVADQLVEPAGFTVKERTNAPAGQPESVIMYAPEAEETAQELATAVEPDLGPTEVVPITDEISAVSRGADIVLLIGQDDDEFGQATAPVQ